MSSEIETRLPVAGMARAGSEGPAFWPPFLMAIAATCICIGIIWDISWHATIGRDTFWTPAHMTIYFGGVLAGSVGGWLAIQSTFLVGRGSSAAVNVFGARAPLGAWVAIWGAIAMLTSAPFDNWWHNAYGLDVKIISPPHTVLGLGMFGICFGALLLVLSRQNREQNGVGSGLFIYVGGVFLALAGVFITEYSFPNLQHAAVFYEVAALTYPIRLVALGRAGRTSWPASKAAAIYMAAVAAMVWFLPLFPARPKLAPIFNPVTHMVPPAFPVLLVLPALGIDLFELKSGPADRWRDAGRALLIGVVFLALFVPAQWCFSKFLLTPNADNWFFAGGRFFGYASSRGEYRDFFWRLDESPFNLRAVLITWLLASGSAWLGLRLGAWMRQVRR